MPCSYRCVDRSEVCRTATCSRDVWLQRVCVVCRSVHTPPDPPVFVLNKLFCFASRRYTVSLYNQGVLNKGLESFEQLLLESGESLLPAVWRLLLCVHCVEYH
jgi:hypothetical protein